MSDDRPVIAFGDGVCLTIVGPEPGAFRTYEEERQ